MEQISRQDINNLYMQLDNEAEKGGYHLNPATEDTRDLVKGLLINEKRYGYWSCPCREATGNKQQDLDIICPCDYRDPDLYDYGTCYCGLYVSDEIKEGKKTIAPIPERRLPVEERNKMKNKDQTISSLSVPVWRCKVCGYLCAKEHAPETCPVCKAKRDRFEIFIK